MNNSVKMGRTSPIYYKKTTIDYLPSYKTYSI